MVQLKLMEDKMAQQNIYDNEVFFEGYKKIRDNKINANNLFEQYPDYKDLFHKPDSLLLRVKKNG